MKRTILIAAILAAGPAFAETGPGSDKAYIFDGPAVRMPFSPRPNPPLALAPLPESARPFVPPPKPAPEPKKNQMQLAQTAPTPPLPPGSFHYDGARIDLKSFQKPEPVTIDGKQQLPTVPKASAVPAEPQPEPEKKPAKAVG